MPTPLTTLLKMDWEATTVLDKETDWARCIKERTSRWMAMKLDLGLNLNPIWNSVLTDT